MIKLLFKKLDPKAIIPQEKDPHDAGLDLYSIESGIIFPNATRAFSTGLALELQWDLPGEVDPYEAPGYSIEYYKALNHDFSFVMNQWLMNMYTPYFKIESRSGLALKSGISVGAGVIDFGYRGEIKIILHNISKSSYEVNAGDKIAQAIVKFKPNISIEEALELSESNRGEGGFGSTGK